MTSWELTRVWIHVKHYNITSRVSNQVSFVFGRLETAFIEYIRADCLEWKWFSEKKANCKTRNSSALASSNGNIFRVTGPLCGEFTGPGEFPTQRGVTRSFDVFLICVWINGWVNNREAGDLRRHRGHYGVNVMHCWQSTFHIKHIKTHIHLKSYILMLKPFFLYKNVFVLACIF